jgi:hypothetical protein
VQSEAIVLGQAAEDAPRLGMQASGQTEPHIVCPSYAVWDRPSLWVVAVCLE